MNTDRINAKHRNDYAELVKLVSHTPFIQLRGILKITQEDSDWMDFNFKSLVATIYKGEQPKNIYLTGFCDLWDEDGSWIDSIQMGEKVAIKYE